MDLLRRFAVFAAVAALIAIVSPAAKAVDDSDWPTLLTIDQPMKVGELVLDPGAYVFQLSPGTVSRSVVMIYSIDKRRWDGFVLGFPAYRSGAQDGFVSDTGPGKEETLRYWFRPGWSRGVEFSASAR